MSFNKLQLIEPVLKALAHEGYSTPTPIQAQAIPVILQGRDLLGCAQTGTGKTAAFAIPIIQLMYQQQQQGPRGRKVIKALVLTPTRELAVQIEESFKAYGRYTDLKHHVIFGGVSQGAQVNTLRRGVDVLVATPGRLLDLMTQGHVSLRDVSFFVLDEADRMLDMGFVHDVKRIITKLPAKRQTLFFSATMPPEIQQLSKVLLTDPFKVAVTPVSSPVEIIKQALYFVERQHKQPLIKHLLIDASLKSVLVFTRTKHGADKVAKDLIRSGISAESIHGNKSQQARQLALNNFKSRRTRVLVATDIAARGIDIDELTHVINYDLPDIAETYVHRIGRTGRAGANGTALSFCASDERMELRGIQKLIGKNIAVIGEHPFIMTTQTNQEQRSMQRPPQRQSFQKRASGNGNAGGNNFRERRGGYRSSSARRA